MNLKRHQTIFVSVLLITIGVVGFFTIEDLISPEGHDMSIFWSMTFTSLVSISIILVNFPIFDKVKLQFPIRIDIFKRLTIAFLISSFTAAIIITIWVLLFNAIFNEYGEAHGVEEFGLAAVIFDNIVIAVIVNFTVGAIMILRYSIIGWKNSIIEAEQYKRQSIESQYSALVNQINPHFLFNSMNALASLIPQSPEKAVEFVNRFSKIYRYVLDVKDKIVCKIKDELDFLDSYCYLQKIRFGRQPAG
jgi:sensor histidine kinase YesM